MSDHNIGTELLIFLNLLLTDNSKALVLYSPTQTNQQPRSAVIRTDTRSGKEVRVYRSRTPKVSMASQGQMPSGNKSSAAIIRKENIRLNPENYNYDYNDRSQVQFDELQVKSKLKHAPDWGLERRPENLPEFQERMQAHIDDPEVVVKPGTYRYTPVVHYLNEKTRRNIFCNADGHYISGWKLSTEQFFNVKDRAAL